MDIEAGSTWLDLGDGAPGRAGRPARRAFALLGTVQVTLIFTITLIAVPLPAIGADLGLGHSQLVVASAAYGLSFSGLLLLGGRLADRNGGRRTFRTGLGIFAVASAAAPLATSFEVLAFSRFGQGIGAALVAPAAMVVLRELYPQPDAYGRAMATWGGLSVLGATTGMVLAGVVVAFASWRWMFAVPVLIAAVAMSLARQLLPKDGPGRPLSLDVPGAIFATSGVTLLSYGLVMTLDHTWASSNVTGPIAAGVVLLIAFGIVELRSRTPLLPLGFVWNLRRGAALIVVGLSAAATAVVSLYLSLYLQEIRSWSSVQTSLAFVPYAVALIAVGRLAPGLVARFGGRVVMVTGLVVGAAGLCSLAMLDPQTTYPAGLLPGLLALPAGVALTFAGAAVLAVAQVPAARIGLAGGVLNTAIELGPTAGLALVSGVVSARAGGVRAIADDATAMTSGYAWGFGVTALAMVLLAGLIGLVPVLLRRESQRSTQERKRP
jgi:MFS family permease